VNNSSAPAGVLITGTSQIVGTIDGSGSVEVGSGSDLTATHIVQNALVIGGTADSPATVTISASDALGNPLAANALANSGAAAPSSMSIAAGSSRASTASTSASFSGSMLGRSTTSLLNSLASNSTSLASRSGALQFYEALMNSMEKPIDNPSSSTNGGAFPGGLELVPEPSTALLFAAGLITAAFFSMRRRRRG